MRRGGGRELIIMPVYKLQIKGLNFNSPFDFEQIPLRQVYNLRINNEDIRCDVRKKKRHFLFDTFLPGEGGGEKSISICSRNSCVLEEGSGASRVNVTICIFKCANTVSRSSALFFLPVAFIAVIAEKGKENWIAAE